MPSWISDSGRSARGSIVWIVLVSLALMLPALLVERTLAGDSHIHIHWQSQFGSLVWSSTPYPRWLPDITVRKLRVGSAKVDIRFWRESEATRHDVLAVEGELKVERRDTPGRALST